MTLVPPNTSSLAQSLDKFPSELIRGGLFCLWTRPAAGGKKPIDPITGKTSATSNVADVSTFEVAATAYHSRAFNPKFKGVAGVGRLIQYQADGIFSVDIDNVTTRIARIIGSPWSSSRGRTVMRKSHLPVLDCVFWARGSMPAALLGCCSKKLICKAPGSKDVEVQLFLKGQFT